LAFWVSKYKKAHDVGVVLGQGDVHGVEPLGLVAGLEFLDAVSPT